MFHQEGSETVYYTVTFNADGGSPATQTRTVESGDTVGSSNMPSNPARNGYTFEGWYTGQYGNGSRFTYDTTVNSNMTVYAGWTENKYTVTFNADGGNPATETQTVTNGSPLGSSNMPSDPTRSGYTFGGWYTEQNGNGSWFTYDTTVNDNMTVYAKWTIATLPSNLSLADALTWISNNAATGNTYTITLRNDETIAPRSLDYSGKTIDITLTGGTRERIVSLSTTGSLFTVGNGVTLTLDNNVTLQGRNNTASLVRVNSGGTLVMNTGSKISDNISSSSSGSGVIVNGGTFTMRGGTISGNTTTAAYGGGVFVSSGGTFTMSGGTINGNTAAFYGGGVYVRNGTFTMRGGTISGNTAAAASQSAYGGGVYVESRGTFTMRGGTISGNTVSSPYYAAYGGGVYVSREGTFTKQSGGVIYGSNESNSTLKNTATYGHAVYVSGSPANKIRNTTADANTTLNSAVSGSAGGWE
ncbi:MAG: InlB B-repeat-containing protein [Treponema sp.]|nr:InlB B-repeat-containing protein [Treponema sp.]